MRYYLTVCFSLSDLPLFHENNNNFLCIFIRTRDNMVPQTGTVNEFKTVKAAYSVTMNIFRKKYFLFKSFVKVE